MLFFLLLISRKKCRKFLIKNNDLVEVHRWHITTIKSIAEYPKEEVNFLDLTIKLIDGELKTDLFVEPTDIHQILIYYPAFQNVRAIVEELHILLTPNKEHKKVFSNVPVIEFQNDKSLKDFLVSATLPKLNKSRSCEPCGKKNLFSLWLYKYCYNHNNHLRKHILSMSKLEHVLSLATSSFDIINIIFLITIYLYFQERITKSKFIFCFYFYHSLLYSWDILQSTIKKTWDFSLEKLGPPYSAWVNFELVLEKCSDVTGVRLNLWYIGLELEKHLDYFTGLGLILSYIKLRLIKWIN